MDMMAAVVARDMACLILGCCQHLGEFDAGFVTHLVQHPDHILGGQVAGGTGSKGTAAQTAQSGLDLGDALSMAAMVLTMPSPRVSWKWTCRFRVG